MHEAAAMGFLLALCTSHYIVLLFMTWDIGHIKLVLILKSVFWPSCVCKREREKVGRKLRISKEAITLSVSLVSTTFSVPPSLPPYVIQINSLHTHTHAHIHARIHARINIHTSAHTHTHTRTHNHKLTWTNGVLRVEDKPWGYLEKLELRFCSTTFVWRWTTYKIYIFWNWGDVALKLRWYRSETEGI